MSEWLGDGAVPVTQSEAEARAATCAVCPNNVKGGWIDRLKGDAARIIKEHLVIKDGAGLQLKSESKIGFCSKCGCSLSLKCWVPIGHIASHTDPSKIKELPSFCWIKTEITQE